MPRRSKQLELAIHERFTHGGRRKGAGRPRTSKRQSHVARARFVARHPLHVTVRLADGLPSLHRKELYDAFRAAVRKAQENGLRIAHFSILSNHLHLILESEDARALARAMQSLGVSLAKRTNARLGRKGSVLKERYHVHVLKTPREVKHALGYVLGNEFRHPGKRGWIALDAFSSAIAVGEDAWRALLGRGWEGLIGFSGQECVDELRNVERDVYAMITPPRTWLLREGWQRARPAKT